MDTHGFSAPGQYGSLDWLLVDAGSAGRTRTFRRRWAKRPRIVMAVVVVLALGLALWALGPRGGGQVPHGPPPHIDAPFAAAALRPLTPQQALSFNANVATTHAPIPAARAFLAAEDPLSRTRAETCLAAAIYYEAGGEPLDGQRAVAQVVLNRVRHPAYPHSVCGVVYQGSERPQGCQFTFTCDGALARRPGEAGWARAVEIAREALAGYVFAPVGWATHYHANYVVPYWAASLEKVAVIGAHIFYRWDGGWGRPGAFASAYAGREPVVVANYGPAAPVPGAAPTDAAEVAATGGKPVAVFDRPVLSNAQHHVDASIADPWGAAPAAATAPVAATPAHARWILDGPEVAPPADRAPAETGHPPPHP